MGRKEQEGILSHSKQNEFRYFKRKRIEKSSKTRSSIFNLWSAHSKRTIFVMGWDVHRRWFNALNWFCRLCSILLRDGEVFYVLSFLAQTWYLLYTSLMYFGVQFPWCYIDILILLTHQKIKNIYSIMHSAIRS